MNDRRYRRVVCNSETGTNRTSLTVSRRRAMSPCRRRRSRARTSPPSRLIPIRSSSSRTGCPVRSILRCAGTARRTSEPRARTIHRTGRSPWSATLMASHGQKRIWFAELGALTSPAAATAPRLAGQQVGVTAARPAEILSDASNDMLTSRSAVEALLSAA
jgi:hypothetical protein